MNSMKTIMLVAIPAVILMLCYTFNMLVSPLQVQLEPSQLELSYPNSTKKHATLMDDSMTMTVDKDPLSKTSIFTDILTEEAALQFQPCKNVKLATEPSLSKMQNHGKSTSLRINDTFIILITLYDGYGFPKTVGGDIVIARLTNPKSRSATSGHVIDHRNGTYTAIFEWLFSGHSFVNVDVLWTREAITSLYRVRKMVPLCLREILATFKDKGYTETTECHPFYPNIQNSNDFCNFTEWNSGMSWFCGRPRDQQLKCSHWKTVQTKEPKAPFTAAERILVNRGVKQLQIPGSIQVHVDDKHGVTDIIQPNRRVPCYKYSPSKLWYTHTSNNGYLYRNKWNLKQCEAVPNVSMCVTNRTLLLFGDSTVRQWYKDVVNRFKCVQQTRPWDMESSYKFSVCKNKDIQFNAEFIPHSQPLYLGRKEVAITKGNSIKPRLSQIRSNEHVIVVIHLYLHLTPCHYNVFKSRMAEIKISVHKLLTRNRLAKVLIKGPALHNELPTVVASYNAYIYRRITFNVFKGLHDKVFYLDYIDFTNALHITKRHPTNEQVSMMVDMALNYVCV